MNKKSDLLAIFFVVLIDFIGFGIVLPLLPFYASKFNANAWQIGFLFSIYSLAQFVFSPLWGRLSDAYGRKLIMFISTAGAIFAYLLFILSQSYGLLFLSRLLAGVLAGNIVAAQSHVSDLTLEKDRTIGMGMIGAAIGLGFTLGPAIASITLSPGWIAWIREIGFDRLASSLGMHPYRLPGCIALILSLSSLIIIAIFIKETPRHQGSVSQTSSWLILRKKFWIDLRSKCESNNWIWIKWMILSMGLLSFVQSSLYAAFPLFCENTIHLSQRQVGLLYVIMGFVAVFVQGYLMRVLVKKKFERLSLVLGAMFICFGLVMIPLATGFLSMAFFLVWMTLGASLMLPSLQGFLSRLTPTLNIGVMLGAAQSIAGLGRVLGPTWGGAMYHWEPKATFWLTACFSVILIIVSIQFFRSNRLE